MTWPTSYRCAPALVSSDGRWSLRAIHWDDRETIRQWRNDQIAVLRQREPLTSDDQDRYFLDVVRPQMDQEHPDQVLVAMVDGDELIAYGGLVHIAWPDLRAELSFLTSPERAADESYGALLQAFVRMVAVVAATELGLHRLTTEAYAFRATTIDALEACGFVREGTLRDHVRVGDHFVDSAVHGMLLEVPS